MADAGRMLQQLIVQHTETAAMVKDLVRAITEERSNGKEQQ
jgi:hypothetical protein